MNKFFYFLFFVFNFIFIENALCWSNSRLSLCVFFSLVLSCLDLRFMIYLIDYSFYFSILIFFFNCDAI